LSVRSIKFAPNSARELEASHAICSDHANILAKGQEVTYTDVELGVVFVGKIVRRKRAKRPGEGVTYICADNYRQLTKSAATLSNGIGTSAKIAFETGTAVQSALSKVLSGVSGHFPGGIAISVGGTLPATDKGGQSVDTWIEDILKNTTGGFAWINPAGGSQALRFDDYYASPGLTLTEGQYVLHNQGNGELLISEGDIEDTLDEKLKKLTVEGAGRFKRWQEKYIYPTYPTDGGDEFRWYVDDGMIIKRYIKPDGYCADGTRMKLRIGGALAIGNVFIINDPPFVNGGPGNTYFWFRVQARTPAAAGNQYTSVEAWFDYTVYEGPLSETVQGSDPLLEGSAVEIHDDYFSYEGPGITVNHAPDLQALAQSIYNRHGQTSDTQGNFTVIIKSVNPNLKLGSRITNFGNARIRQITYLISQRLMQLEMSDVPLKDRLQTSKQIARERTLPGNNWYQNRVPASLGCFSNWSSVLSSNGTTDNNVGGGGWGGGAGGGGGGGRGPGVPNPKAPGSNVTSWRCVNGQCEEREGDEGFATQEECEKICGATSWERVNDCFCHQRNDVTGPFKTKAECEAGIPANCGGVTTVDPNNPPPPPEPPPVPPVNPPAEPDTKTWAPATNPFNDCIGVVTEIVSDDKGHVIALTGKGIRCSHRDVLENVSVVCNGDGTITVTKTFTAIDYLDSEGV